MEAMVQQGDNVVDGRGMVLLGITITCDVEEEGVGVEEVLG
jgi:hypothetical protein